MATLTPESIRIIRTHLGLTQGQLARRSGISTALVSSIEREEKRLLSEVEQRIRSALAINDDTVEEIL
ncbi:helix-turn-helix domain-containing protein [Heliobacterium gestii]|uniref:Helix-turn-helix domain-containing protein n=1 Tax=Heliomicrobium gestii TaxID=2699 RepID=A0A845LEP3_HELGE|nr:helix-turn-helix domain-containing protein [Heliomicrobium gestii]MBM7867323.1 transcriptional regulator with XRE-family HTH domain [Heliomicrobium gestii]MZP44638.1 helix-turn-helix domain-containing protein [Heliomicrobium gestii]